MYEKPELTKVGDAKDTILGIVVCGCDLDMNWTNAREDYEKDSSLSE
jgi:hypothetical protein